MMDSEQQDKKRLHVEYDRLSSLPDDLIHKILSFIGIKQAVQTSALSSRWRFIWTLMPYLNFSTGDFCLLSTFSKFVTHVLSHRNHKIEVSSVELIFRGKVSQLFVKRILVYAFSHNVQRMSVTCVADRNKKSIDFPLSLFRSRSLKHLTIVGDGYRDSINAMLTWELPCVETLYLEHIIFWDESTGLFSKCANLKNLTLKLCCMKTLLDPVNPDSFIMPMSVLEFPTLTTLDLCYITLHDVNTDKSIGLFSKCTNLKSLTLRLFAMAGSTSFSICHPRLSSLTLVCDSWSVNVLNVIAPQLENLTIRNSGLKHVISAPQLASLTYRGNHPLMLSTDGFHSLQRADICISSRVAKACKIVGLLQQLHSVKFLTLNTEIVKRLSSSTELISHQPSPFSNLKRLKIYPKMESFWKRPNEKVTMSNEVKNYLLESSPSATFTMVSNEEITALKNAKSARKLMGELQVVLEQRKKDIDTNTAHLDQGKTPNVNEMAQLEMKIQRYWKYMKEQMAQDEIKTCQIISMLKQIEELLTNLPPSQRVEIQAMFSTLYAEANIAMTKILDACTILSIA